MSPSHPVDAAMLAYLLPSRPSSGRAALVAALVVLCLVIGVAPVGAAEPGVAAAAPLAFLNDVIGNRARMIQIACVIGAIGIFWLTRAIK
jgi:hypothetical protein